jgi:hypothetical protein
MKRTGSTKERTTKRTEQKTKGTREEGKDNLSGSHSLLEGSLDAEGGSSELVSGGVLTLEELEGLGKLTLDGGLSSSLDLHGEFGRGEGLLDGVDLGLEVGLVRRKGREKN